jgi:NagD protein
MSSRPPLFPGYVFDLDGTIYLGDALLPGAAPTIETVRGVGSRLVFLSNKPTESRATYASKLTRLGIPCAVDEVINSTWVLVRWIQREAPGAKLFVIGEPPLLDELAQAGFVLVERAADVDFVVASFDRTFTYRKLQVAFDAIRAGARFVATNADPFCPVPGGGEPDAGAIIGAIEGCTGVPVEVVVGKPSPITAQAILDRLSLKPEDCVIVGDRLSTDIRMGRDAGMVTALVLTGVTTRELLLTSPIRPDYVLDSLDQLIPRTQDGAGR